MLLVAAIGGTLVKSQEKQRQLLQEKQKQIDTLNEQNGNLKKDIEQKQKDYEALKLSKAEEARITLHVSKNAIEWKPLIAKYFPEDQVANAIKIVNAESGGVPSKLSPTADRGLFQINAVHAGRVGGNLAALYDPETNVKVAYAIWSEQGWNPWTTKGVLSS